MKRKFQIWVALTIIVSMLFSLNGCMYQSYFNNESGTDLEGNTIKSSKNIRGIHIINGDNPVHFVVKTDIDRENGYKYIISEDGDRMELPPGTFIFYWGDVCPICEKKKRE